MGLINPHVWVVGLQPHIDHMTENMTLCVLWAREAQMLAYAKEHSGRNGLGPCVHRQRTQ